MDNETPVMDFSEDQNISIDRLEDEIIDHPSSSAGASQFSDESFQSKLNERANQIQQGGEWSSSNPSNPYSDSKPNANSYQFLDTKPNLIYEHADLGGLKEELEHWFAASDFASIGLRTLQSAPRVPLNLDKPPSANLIDLSREWDWLDSLVYFILGEFTDSDNELAQLHKIESNCDLFLTSKSFAAVAKLLGCVYSEFLKGPLGDQAKAFSAQFASNYLKLMTTIYFTLNVALKRQSRPDAVLEILSDVDLLTKIVKLCETWNVSPDPRFRIRNCLLVQWKLLLLELGDSKIQNSADEYLSKRYNVKNKKRKNKSSKQLVCSPIEYFTYEEDLQDKYPLKKSEDDVVSSSLDFHDNDDTHSLSTLLSDSLSLSQEHEIFMANKLHSSSLSSFIDVPRTNKSHSVYGNLPGSTVHIATPVPSPPTTPSEFMSGGEKVRKSYHVNQGLPFIYPFQEDHKVPEAISEASRLIEDGIYESYSAKRLSHEQNIFLSQERGNGTGQVVNAIRQSLIVDEKYPSDSNVERSLNRAETYYKNSLEHLRGFVEVLVSIIKMSKVDLSLRDLEKELDPHTSFSERFGGEESTNKQIPGIIFHRLDVLRAKEISLKAASAILALTLRWFKLSHPIKAHYFSSLLFDAKFFSIFIDFLSDSFNNPCLQNSVTENKNMQSYDVLCSQNRLLNPSIAFPQFSFLKACQGRIAASEQKYTLVNKTPAAKLSHAYDEEKKLVVNITEFNHDFGFILVNLLKVTQKILIRNVSQRVFILNDTKPTDFLKIILLNYVNEDLRKPILKIFKKTTPYQGRKWRALNMDVISLIYLHMKLSLKDNWLSGKDLENEFKDSYDQEISLRSFLQFYNVRHYPDEMRALGYESEMSNLRTYDV